MWLQNHRGFRKAAAFVLVRLTASTLATQVNASPVQAAVRHTTTAGGPAPAVGNRDFIQLGGLSQVVFSWSRQACEQTDIPDTPARAFRDASGRVQLLASDTTTRRMAGPTLNQLTHDCTARMTSQLDGNPADFQDRQWIHATYTLDGQTVYGLVHDEYHGYQHAGMCPGGQFPTCWYNSVTLAVSTDGGDHFSGGAANQLVASVPYQYTPGQQPYGMFEPSNIVRNPNDGYYYTMVHVEPHGVQNGGACLLRTTNLADPGSWRAWGGLGFQVWFNNPYTQQRPPENHICVPVGPDQVGTMSSSLTYNTALGKFLLVGEAGRNIPGRGMVIGIYYTLSTDLIHWSTAQLLWETPVLWSWQPGQPDAVAYPSVLDPSSPSRSFDTSGTHPFLYLTRLHPTNGTLQYNRDLIRIPLTINP